MPEVTRSEKRGLAATALMDIEQAFSFGAVRRSGSVEKVGVTAQSGAAAP